MYNNRPSRLVCTVCDCNYSVTFPVHFDGFTLEFTRWMTWTGKYSERLAHAFRASSLQMRLRDFEEVATEVIAFEEVVTEEIASTLPRTHNYIITYFFVPRMCPRLIWWFCDSKISGYHNKTVHWNEWPYTLTQVKEHRGGGISHSANKNECKPS